MDEVDVGQLHAERMERLLPTGRGVWIPIDHSVSDWPVPGLEGVGDLVAELTRGRGVDAIVAHRGPIGYHYFDTEDTWNGGWVLHASASTRHGGPRSSYKVLAGDPASLVECAVERGAIGVSVQVNLGDDYETEMLAHLATVADECHFHGVPLLGMIYPRGPHLSPMEGDETNGVSHAARVGWELGCDAVKVPWTGDSSSFKAVVDTVPIPVLVAGGPKGEDFSATLRMVKQAMAAGAAGVCMGRQVFADEDPAARVTELIDAVHGIHWDADGRFKFDVEESEALEGLYESFKDKLESYGNK